MRNNRPGNKPSKSFKRNGIYLPVWDNGKKCQSLTIRKSWMVGPGEWRNSHYFYRKDIPEMIALLKTAYREMEGDGDGDGDGEQ